MVGKAVGRWIGVGIEHRLVHAAAARPEPGGRHLVAIGLPGNLIGKRRNLARMKRRLAARKPCDGQVEGTPEQMHWRDLTEKAGPEPREDPIDLQQGHVEPLDRLRVVGPKCAVLGKRLRIRDLAGSAMECPSARQDRKSTRLNSSHVRISYAVFCLKKKKQKLKCTLL